MPGAYGSVQEKLLFSRMAGKTNGSGHNNDTDEKLIRFPTLAERDKIRREKEKQEQAFQQQYKNERRATAPFINLSKIPVFTRVLVLSFIVVHVSLALLLSEDRIYDVYTVFGFTPARFTGGTDPLPFEAFITPLTHLFLHGNMMHLLFNSITALIMGMLFERQFGARMTAFFFFACSLGGALFYFLLNPFSPVPIIGASGGLSGLFSAGLIMIFQRQPNLRHSRWGAWPMLIFWIVFMIGMGSIGGDMIAWQSHVGGFLTGIALLHLIQKGYLRF